MYIITFYMILCSYIYSSGIGEKTASTQCRVDDECAGVSKCSEQPGMAGLKLCTCLNKYTGPKCDTLISRKSLIPRHQECLKDSHCDGNSKCVVGTHSVKRQGAFRKVHGICVCNEEYGGANCQTRVNVGVGCSGFGGCSEEMNCEFSKDKRKCICAGGLDGKYCADQKKDTVMRGDICTRDDQCKGFGEDRSICGRPAASIATIRKMCLCNTGYYGDKCQFKEQLMDAAACRFSSDCAGASTCYKNILSKTGKCFCTDEFIGDKCDAFVGPTPLKIGALCVSDNDHCGGDLKCLPAGTWPEYQTGEDIPKTCQCPFGIDCSSG